MNFNLRLFFFVISSFLTNVLIGGLEKSYTLLYIEIINKYNTTSTIASTIAGVTSSIRLILGPLTIALISYFGCRKVAFVGGIFCGIGIFMCSFAKNILQFFIGYGIITGFGFNLIFLPSVIIITKNFEQYRATMLSITSSGIGLGGAIFPFLMSFLLETYGLENSLFLTSALMLNTCVFSLFYKDEINFDIKVIEEKGDQQSLILEVKRNRSIEMSLLHVPVSVDTKGLCQFNSATNLYRFPSFISHLSRNSSDFTAKTTPVWGGHLAPQSYCTSRSSKKCILDFEGSIVEIERDNSTMKTSLIDHANDYDSENPFEEIRQKHNFLYALFQSLNKSFGMSEIFRNVNVMLFAFAHVPLIMGFTVWSMYIVDFAMEHGVGQSQAISLLPIEGFSQLFSRLLTGFIFDKMISKRYRATIVLVSILVATSTCFSMNIIPSIGDPQMTFAAYVAISMLRGLAVGIVLSQDNIVIGGYCPVEQLSTAIGILSLTKGTGILAGSFVAGYVMDEYASYTIVYSYLGSMQLASSFIFLYIVLSNLFKK